MKHLYLMRHGETLFNVRCRIQGWCDSPLTENGIEQAKRACEMLKGIEFDHYYCSTAERACDTMELVAPGKPYVRLKGLKERGFGTFEGESEDLNPPRYGTDPGFSYDDLFPHYGGETSEDVRVRVCGAINEIMEKEDHHTVLVVSHGGASTRFLATVADPAVVFQRKRFPNCAALHFTYQNGEYEFVEMLVPEQ